MRYTQSSLLENAESMALSGQMSAQPDLLHLVYSDGLASVSVFIEKKQVGGKHLQGAATMGAVNAFGNSVEDYFVTVVGEVPEKTVRSMAQSAVRISQ
jgi:sigma-E factor negative regulatory protein RseB